MIPTTGESMFYDAGEDVWEIKWLTHKYQVEVVEKIIQQSWAIDEISAGVELEKIEDLIWEDYPAWALQVLLNAKEERQLNYE